MFRNRQISYTMGNEEDEGDSAMFNIGEEPLGKGARSALFTGEPLNSVLCNNWGGNGVDGGRASQMFSPNSILSSSTKVSIGDCSAAFVDHRRWGGPEKKMEKQEYEKRGAEVLMRLSNYKPPVQERNEENEWDAITSYVTAEPMEKIARMRDAAAAETKREGSGRRASSGRFLGRFGSPKLSHGEPEEEETMVVKENDDQGLPHSSGFNEERDLETDKISRKYTPQPLSSLACSVPQGSNRGSHASTSEKEPSGVVEVQDESKGSAEKVSLPNAGSSSGSKRCRSAGSQGAPTPKSTEESQPKPSEDSEKPFSDPPKENGTPSTEPDNSDKPAESPSKNPTKSIEMERKGSTFSPLSTNASPRGVNALRRTKQKDTALRLLAKCKRNDAG